MTTIKQLPPETRPRERLAAVGAGALSDAELLAILLRTGARKKSALALAHDVLTKIPDMQSLSRMRLEDLCTLQGMGQIKAMTVLAAAELGRRLLGKNGKMRIKLSSPGEVGRHVWANLRGLSKEHFLALYLDAKNRLLSQEMISMGTLDSSHAHAREIFQGAIAAGAKSVIMAHNHPSGDPAPSKEDVQVTKQLREAGKIVGIEVLDHVIVGDDGWVSMREDGLW